MGSPRTNPLATPAPKARSPLVAPPALAALSDEGRGSGSARWLLSFALHAALAGGLVAIRTNRTTTESVAIEVVEQAAKKKAAPEPPAPEPLPEAPPQSRARPAARAPQPAARPTPAAPEGPTSGDAPLIDVALGNGPGGFAVAAPAPTGSVPPVARTTKSLVAAPLPASGAGDDCTEPAGKPKPKSVPQPSYPESARAAGISGKVRVEIAVDERGAVKSARVVAGLGHGLDEAALAAARAASFSPAMRCGKPVASTFVVGMRFAL